jgi:hypothetical protein
VKISRNLQIVIDNSWERFIGMALDTAFVAGVVVYYLDKHPTQPAIPVACDPDTYRLFITTEGCNNKLHAEPVDPLFKKELYIWDGFGYPWSRTGQPSTPVASVLPIVETIRSYIDTGKVHTAYFQVWQVTTPSAAGLLADALASNPTIVTTVKQRASAGNMPNMEVQHTHRAHIPHAYHFT